MPPEERLRGVVPADPQSFLVVVQLVPGVQVPGVLRQHVGSMVRNAHLWILHFMRVRIASSDPVTRSWPTADLARALTGCADERQRGHRPHRHRSTSALAPKLGRAVPHSARPWAPLRHTGLQPRDLPSAAVAVRKAYRRPGRERSSSLWLLRRAALRLVRCRHQRSRPHGALSSCSVQARPRNHRPAGAHHLAYRNATGVFSPVHSSAPLMAAAFKRACIAGCCTASDLRLSHSSSQTRH
jgi:hypothetical protein